MERYLAILKKSKNDYTWKFKGGHRCYDAINIGDIYK